MTRTESLHKVLSTTVPGSSATSDETTGDCIGMHPSEFPRFVFQMLQSEQVQSFWHTECKIFLMSDPHRVCAANGMATDIWVRMNFVGRKRFGLLGQTEFYSYFSLLFFFVIFFLSFAKWRHKIITSWKFKSARHSLEHKLKYFSHRAWSSMSAFDELLFKIIND